MKQTIYTVIVLLLFALTACGGGSVDTSVSVEGCPTGFDKSAVIFDTVTICATAGVSPDKLAHAANVTAEWLDNDEDGNVDEPRLIEAMKENRPIVIMTGDVLSGRAKNKLYDSFDDQSIQDLGAAETNPSGDRRDASQEEIHHIIMNAGWQKLYPAIFSEVKGDNSLLYQTWQFADDNGHYSYNDPTCNASCKVTEFVYLATAAYLGSPADLESDEMRLKTRAALVETVPAMIEIFESADYVYPTNHWPDGTYPHNKNINFYEATQ